MTSNRPQTNGNPPAEELFNFLDNSSIGTGSVQAQLGSLYSETSAYRKSENYRRFLALCANFKRYSIYNTGLIYTQMPGARFYLPQNQWERLGRLVKNDERPLIALQPYAPIILLYDISQTIPINPGHLPSFCDEMLGPFDDSNEIKPVEKKKLSTLLDNLPYYGILFSKMRTGSLYAGKLQVGVPNDPLLNVTWNGKDGLPHTLQCHPAYTLKCSEGLSEASLFPVIAHELGHFFLRHLPCAYEEKWGDPRHGLDESTCEFEAESVSWLVCKRLQIESPSQKYLAGYLDANQVIPPVNILAITKAVEQIESLYRSIAINKGMLYKHNHSIKEMIEKLEQH